MHNALARLIQALPPPENPTGRGVSWQLFEEGLGLTYPTHFKELIAEYGGSIFFDNFSTLYPEASSFQSADQFVDEIRYQLNKMVEVGIVDDDFQLITVPLYPEPGGLFPYMASYDGYTYLWKTGRGNPDEWPQICWEMGVLRPIEAPTLADFFLQWIEQNRERMPNRIRVDRWIPPTANTPSR